MLVYNYHWIGLRENLQETMVNGGYVIEQFRRNWIWVCLKMLCTPKNPMVLLIIIPTKWLFHWGIYPIFRHTQVNSMIYGTQL